MVGGTNFPKRHDFTHPNDHIPHTYEMTCYYLPFYGKLPVETGNGFDKRSNNSVGRGGGVADSLYERGGDARRLA